MPELLRNRLLTLWLALIATVLAGGAGCQRPEHPAEAEKSAVDEDTASAPPARTGERAASEPAPSIQGGVEPRASTRSLPEGAGPLSALSGQGEVVRFDLVRAFAHFEALTSFAYEFNHDAGVQSPDAPGGFTREQVLFRQGYGRDFAIDMNVSVHGSEAFDRRSGMDVVLKGPWLYVRVGDGKFYRRKAADNMSATEYIQFDNLRRALDLMQRGSKFSLSPTTYLGRSAKLHRIVASVPLEENPAYGGQAPSRSSQSGEVVIDEETGLVLRLVYDIQRENTSPGGSTLFEERYAFAVTGTGAQVEIETPENWSEAPPAPMGAPAPAP